MEKKKDIKVSVICTAFNHEPYIRQTLDSFVHQKTNFDYEIIIHDDASTDGTAAIIGEYAKRYPELIIPIFQEENQYSQGKSITLDYIFPHVRGTYIAPCEGDDYWPDENKLQRQYDFLNEHKECSAVCGVTRYFNDENVECWDALPNKEYVDAYSAESDYLKKPGANISINTLMYRKEIIFDQNYINAKRASTKVGDILLMLMLYENGKIYVMNDCFQMHRVQTRVKASNYNSIFDWKAKFLHCTEVVNAVSANYQKEHDMHEWYDSQVVSYYVNAFRLKDIDSFYEIYNVVNKEYQRNIYFLLLKYFSSKVINKVKIFFEKF